MVVWWSEPEKARRIEAALQKALAGRARTSDVITFFSATSLPTIVIGSRASYSPASSSSAPDPFPLSLPASSRKSPIHSYRA